MATIKANKDKARFVSNTISQDALDGDWVDHEVITKYKLPEIELESSTTTTSIESKQEILNGAKLKVLDGANIVERTAGTVTPLNVGSSIIFDATKSVGGASTLTNSNKTFSAATAVYTTIYSASDLYALGLDFYIEFRIDNEYAGTPYVGFNSNFTDNIRYGISLGLHINSSNGAIGIDNVNVATLTRWNDGDIIGIGFKQSDKKFRIFRGTILEYTTTATTATVLYPFGMSGPNTSATCTILSDKNELSFIPSEYTFIGIYPKYQAPITATTNIPTKAYFNKTIDTTLSAEATGNCKSSTITQIGVL